MPVPVIVTVFVTGSMVHRGLRSSGGVSGLRCAVVHASISGSPRGECSCGGRVRVFGGGLQGCSLGGGGACGVGPSGKCSCGGRVRVFGGLQGCSLGGGGACGVGPGGERNGAGIVCCCRNTARKYSGYCRRGLINCTQNMDRCHGNAVKNLHNTIFG